jgi:hypothetical protein
MMTAVVRGRSLYVHESVAQDPCLRNQRRRRAVAEYRSHSWNCWRQRIGGSTSSCPDITTRSKWRSAIPSTFRKRRTISGVKVLPTHTVQFCFPEILLLSMTGVGGRSRVVVEALCYKPEGRGFHSRCNWIFYFPPPNFIHLRTGTELVSET